MNEAPRCPRCGAARETGYCPNCGYNPAARTASIWVCLVVALPAAVVGACGIDMASGSHHNGAGSYAELLGYVCTAVSLLTAIVAVFLWWRGRA